MNKKTSWDVLIFYSQRNNPQLETVSDVNWTEWTGLYYILAHNKQKCDLFRWKIQKLTQEPKPHQSEKAKKNISPNSLKAIFPPGFLF